MAQKTSINIKPCNIGSSEAHNKRTAEYLANIRKEKFYIRTDLMAGNEAWVSPDFGEATLTDRYNQIAAMVKEKTGRAMQTKDRERVNKKTGKVSVAALRSRRAWLSSRTTPRWSSCGTSARCVSRVGESQPCKCSSTVTRDITEYPATMPHGSPTSMLTSYGTG